LFVGDGGAREGGGLAAELGLGRRSVQAREQKRARGRAQLRVGKRRKQELHEGVAGSVRLKELDQQHLQRKQGFGVSADGFEGGHHVARVPLHDLQKGNPRLNQPTTASCIKR
jgi:hypothetical protein